MVFVAALDPVATGVVASLGWPGGNVTGVAVMHSALTAKRLELVKELLPNVSRVAILVRATSPAATEYTQQAEAAARSLGIALQVLTARDPLELEGTLITARGASALIQSDDAVFTAHRTEIANSALKNRLPLVSGLREVVEAAVLSPTERIRGNSTGTLPPTSTRS